MQFQKNVNAMLMKNKLIEAIRSWFIDPSTVGIRATNPIFECISQIKDQK